MATILESNLLAKKHLIFYHGQLLSTRRSSEKYLGAFLALLAHTHIAHKKIKNVRKSFLAPAQSTHTQNYINAHIK